MSLKNSDTQRGRGFKRLPLLVAMLGCLYGTQALAQQQTPPPQTEEEAEQAERERQQQQQQQQQPANQQGVTTLEGMTVTGSLLRRLEYDTTSPVQVITADTSVDVGQVQTAEFLQKSSVAAGSTQITNQFSGFVVEGGTGVQTVSLRGLGAQRTLVLLNGNRPGPAGTRGQVLAFDLNVVPSSILQRAEVLKDGASSIYGSDAVAGVVNLITRKSVDRPEISFSTRVPLKGGGETFEISGATGWNLGNGNIVLAAELYRQNALKVGDRDYFDCVQDLVYDAEGNRVDREDRSILAGTDLGGCNNMLVNVVDDMVSGARYVPSPDGVTVGLLPGFRPGVTANYSPTNPQAYTESPQNFAQYANADLINRQERGSIYAAADLGLTDNLNWTSEFLYNRRETTARGVRQFFPVIGGRTAPARFGSLYQYANSPNYVAPVPNGIARPIMPFASNQDIQVDYLYVNTGLNGYLPFKDWSWKANASYSKSKGTYDVLSIRASTSGDVTLSETAPTLNYFDPGFLSGARMDELVDALGVWHKGETTYNQLVVGGVVTGEAFELPAGAVGVALGAEYRRFDIDDQPSELSRTGDLWGQSSAQVTKGKDSVREVYGEVEIPLLAAKPWVEMLSLNASARAFNYDTVEGWDNVWKLGLGWQINPGVRLRATKGTSYRAPGLYELYLGNQTGFLGQTSIDPCVRWGESSNEYLRANCAAAGIPNNYTGLGSSATVRTGGGLGFLKPETSRAFTTGVVLTPQIAPISVALDYFEFEVADQIGTLGAGTIVSGCYAAQVYPNEFCSMFSRNSPDHPTSPNMITQVNATYVNINKQKTRGYDMLVRYSNDHSYGKLDVEGQFTYMLEDFTALFSPTQSTGFLNNDRNGDIGRPKLVGNVRTALTREDLTYTWFMDYVGDSTALGVAPTVTYLGRPDTYRDVTAGSRLYHAFSVRYNQPKWNAVVGISNIFDTKPAELSNIGYSRYGITPAFATQYDILGRSVYGTVTYKF